jgi:hypothetical protein
MTAATDVTDVTAATDLTARAPNDQESACEVTCCEAFIAFSRA